MQSTAVVSSLFPQVVHDRIFRTAQQKEGHKSLDLFENAKLRLQQFLSGDGDDNGESPEHGRGTDMTSYGAPIAELFQIPLLVSSLKHLPNQCFKLFKTNLSSLSLFCE